MPLQESGCHTNQERHQGETPGVLFCINGKRHSSTAKPACSYCALYGSIMVNLVPTRGLLDTLTDPPIAWMTW